MKLIYCEECGDMVKLTKHELRKCRCGKIRGRYLPDGGHAEVSSNAISVVIGNPQLKSAIREMRSLLKGKPEASKAAFKKKGAIALAYVRPNKPPGNTRTTVNDDL